MSTLKVKIQGYATTVLLIVGGFFENPYVNGDSRPED